MGIDPSVAPGMYPTRKTLLR